MVHSTPKGAIAVTGASGELGGRVAALLALNGTPQIMISRAPTSLPEFTNAQRRGPALYSDGEAVRRALEGASTLVLISGMLSGRRYEDHANVVNAALAVGVQRVIYVSLIGASPTATYRNARDHWSSERFIVESGVRHTIVRAGIYGVTLAGLANDDFVIRGPGGTGRVAFVAHDDIAAVVAAVAQESTSKYDSEILEITGPESVSIEDAVAQIAAATGRPYRYEPETLEEAFLSRARRGLPGSEIEGWVSWYQAIGLGHLDRVTDVVERITGAAPVGLANLVSWPEPDAYIDANSLSPMLQEDHTALR